MSKIEDSVCDKMQARAHLGLTKYGRSLERTDLSRLQWLIHAQEEAMDLAAYLEKLIQDGQQIGSQTEPPTKEQIEALAKQLLADIGLALTGFRPYEAIAEYILTHYTKNPTVQ